MRPSRSRALLALLFLATPVVYLACSGDDSSSTTPDAATPPPPGTTPPTPPPTPPTPPGQDGSTDAGPGVVSLAFDPAGNGDPISLHWDDVKGKLFIADNRNNQLWSWTDAAGFVKLGKVPDDPVADDAGRTNLGQIVELADGTLVVPRFGFGSVGTIVTFDPAANDGGTVPGLAANRKRTALAIASDGTLWGGYFFTPGDGKGVVTKVDLTTGETDYAIAFQKPVGVLVQNGQLVVSEQQSGIIYSLPLDGGFGDGGPYPVFANVPSCDALTSGPNGSVITGQFKPLADGGPLQIRQAWPDGGFDVLYPDAGLTKPQGVAYDKTNRRLFVADSNGTTVRTIKIFPLP